MEVKKISTVEEQAKVLIGVAYDIGYGEGENSRQADLAPIVVELRRAIRDVLDVLTPDGAKRTVVSFNENSPLLVGLRKLLIDTDIESGNFTVDPIYERQGAPPT